MNHYLNERLAQEVSRERTTAVRYSDETQLGRVRRPRLARALHHLADRLEAD